MELASLLSSHAASTPSACGFLVGVAGADGGVVPFSAVRCVHLASGALLPTPQWEREASEAASHLPLGLSLIGFYAACEPSELAKLVGEHASALRTALAPAARHAFAAVPKGGSSPPAFFTASLPSSGAGSVELKESAADADDSLSSVMIALRAAPLIHLHIKVAAADKAGKAWAAAHAAASEAALAQLTSSRACFAFAEARHVGVVGLESGSERVAPPASGLCGALVPLDAAAEADAVGEEAGGEEEEEAEEEEWGESEAGRARGKKKGAAAKGKKKGGGKARKGGGGGGGASRPGTATEGDSAGAAEGVDAPLPPGCPLSVQVLWPHSAPLSGARHEAPVLSVSRRPSSVKETTLVSLPLQLDTVVYCRRDATLASALASLQDALGSQLRRLAAAQLAAAPSADVASEHRASANVFRLPDHVPFLHTMLYVLPAGCDAVEAPSRPAREAAHTRLGLPTDRPLLRTCNALPMGAAGWAAGGGGVASPIPGILRDPHRSLGSSGVKGGVQALVQGSYEYFHYMQWTGCGQKAEKYDDCGWGCAYRSLQSIISWFRLQGYTSLPNPTHYEIQKVLVDHCGQDAGTLLGKKMWLGSQDLGYYLDHTLGVECRTTTFHSGEDVAGGGRKLLHHFQTQGTPVMIGGGELAFTLLGVDFEERSGEIRFLIMDPHYQGADELGLIQPKWVGWKSAESLTHLNTKLFKADTSYNFCMPTRPNGV